MTGRQTERGRQWRFGRAAQWLVAVILVVWTAGFILQHMLADQLLRAVLDAQGLPQVSAQVRQAGWFHARVDAVRFGTATDAPQVADVELHYSPVSLLRQNIHAIHLRDVRVALALADRRTLTVDGLDPAILAWARKSASAPSKPWRVGLLTADARFTLRLAAGGEPLTGTASLVMNSRTGSLTRLQMEARLDGWGTLSADARLARLNSGWRVAATAAARVSPAAATPWLPPEIEWLGDDLRLYLDALLSGPELRAMDGTVAWKASLGPQQLRMQTHTLAFSEAVVTGRVEIAASQVRQATAGVFCEAIRGESGALTAVKRMRLQAVAEVPFTNASGTIDVDLDGLSGPFGRLTNGLAQSALEWQVGVASGLTARVSGTCNVSTALVNGVSSGRVSLSAPVAWQVAGAWRQTAQTGKAGLGSLRLTSTAPVELALAGARLRARPVLAVAVERDRGRTALTGEMELSDLSGHSGIFTYGATGAVLRVEAGAEPFGDLRGKIECQGGWLRDAGPGVAVLDGLRFYLPLPMGPVAAKLNQCPVSLDWRRLELGGVAWQPESFSMTGTVDGCDLALTTRAVGSALTMQAKVRLDWHGAPSAAVVVEFPAIRLATNDTVIAALTRRMGTDVTFAGITGGRLTALLTAGQLPVFRGAWQVREATVASPGKWQVAGLSISTALRGQGPADWRLEADEDTRFHSLTAGNLVLTNGLFRWVVLPHELFVERGGFNWCGGAVRMYAVHASLNNPQAECVLYLDQVDLGQLLTQMKVLRGTGSGTLYGRLPLRLQGGAVRLSDGFLYSLPGEGGRLQVTNTEYMSQMLGQANLPAMVRDRLVAALTDLDFSLFRMDLEPPGANGDALLRLRIAGQAHARPGEPPVDLNVNVKGPLEQLFNMGLKLRE
jgi:hypothetical protein